MKSLKFRIVETHLSAWEQNIGQEVDFWRKWLTEEKFSEYREAQLYRPDHYLNHLLARIGNPQSLAYWTWAAARSVRFMPQPSGIT